MGYALTLLSNIFGTFIVSVGTHLTVTVSGIFFMALPVTYASGAYVMVILQKAGLSLPLAILISILFALMLALFFAVVYIKMSDESYAVFTLSSLVAMDALAKSWDSVTGGVMGISGITRPDFISTLPKLVLFQGVIALIIFVVEGVLLKTAYGRHLRAHKENKIALASLGTSAKKTGAIVITLALALGAVEGILAIWRIQYLDPSFSGIQLLLTILTVAILANKPKAGFLGLATIFVILLPEALRFLHISSVIMGHMRVILYSLLVIIMIRILSGRSSTADRSY